MAEVVIIGAGPAGLSAALWLRHLGLEPLVLERRTEAGGMLLENELINDWVLGHPGATGRALAARFAAHVLERDVALYLNAALKQVARCQDHWLVSFQHEGKLLCYQAAAILLATGTSIRGIEAMGSAQKALAQLGSEHLAVGPEAFAELKRCCDQSVLIIGGGDNAFENAYLLLSHGARRVSIAVRSTPRAQAHWYAKLKPFASRLEMLLHTELVDVQLTSGELLAILEAQGTLIKRTINRIHLLIGYQPNCAVLSAFEPSVAALIERSAAGYLVTDMAGRTTLAGCYAAGDLSNPDFPSVVSAIASGARAAKAIEADLRNAASALQFCF